MASQDKHNSDKNDALNSKLQSSAAHEKSHNKKANEQSSAGNDGFKSKRKDIWASYLAYRAWIKKHYVKIVLWSTAILTALTMTFMVGGAYLCAPDLTKYHERSHALYDKEGTLIYSSMSEGDYYRLKTTAQDVDPLYLKMLLAAEDERFYHHLGVDPFSIVRAAFTNLQAGSIVSGASTLAMQVCRMLEPKERTILGKVQEALGALYITNVYGKDEVLNMYLTLAPFGGNIEGVSAASYRYFNHSPKHLTPAEAALLVALPRSPEKMRPDRKPKAARYYRNEVLKKAVADGIIKEDILTTATAEAIPYARFDLPNSAFHLGQSIFTGKLQSPDLQALNLNTTSNSAKNHKGKSDNNAASAAFLPRELKTTIDPKVQSLVNRVTEEFKLRYLSSDEQESMAVLVVDNTNFEVRGYVGSFGRELSYVDAVQALRSPGSALKPFAYGMAFEQGLLHPNSILLDISRLYSTYQPRNYDRKFYGQITAQKALQSSLNLPALEIMKAVGPLNFITRLNSLDNTVSDHRPITIYDPYTKYSFSKTANDMSNAQNMNHALDGSVNKKSTEDEQNTLTYPQGRLVLPSRAHPALGLVLGGVGISLYDLTQLYAAIAHDGAIKPLAIVAHDDDKSSNSSKGNKGSNHATPSVQPIVLDYTKEAGYQRLMSADASRALYKILQGTPAPFGFYQERGLDNISYKTGTSFRYRDAWALGSWQNYTVGVWVGRNDGSPTKNFTGFSNSAPVLFSVLNELKALTNPNDLPKIKRANLDDSPLLRHEPPTALTKIEIKDIGLVKKTTDEANERLVNNPTLASKESAAVSNERDNNNKQGNSNSSAYQNLVIEFPIDGSRLNVGRSNRIMIKFTGGMGPFYVLINDEMHDHVDYFVPEHNGIYTITIIDSQGNSAISQVFVQGVKHKNKEDQEQVTDTEDQTEEDNNQNQDQE